MWAEEEPRASLGWWAGSLGDGPNGCDLSTGNDPVNKNIQEKKERNQYYRALKAGTSKGETAQQKMNRWV